MGRRKFSVRENEISLKSARLDLRITQRVAQDPIISNTRDVPMPVIAHQLCFSAQVALGFDYASSSTPGVSRLSAPRRMNPGLP